MKSGTDRVRIAVVAGMLGLGLVPAAAEQASPHVQAYELSAQARRAPPRLRVSPGRLLYRDCKFRLVQQMRPGGPVIVPWQQCWWVRG